MYWGSDDKRAPAMSYPTSSEEKSSLGKQPQHNAVSSSESDEGWELPLDQSIRADSPPSYEEVADMRNTIAKLEPPPNAGSESLAKIVAIPATGRKLGSPFLRAYPPALGGFGISQEVFLEFVDHINRAAVASPPLQILSLAGGIVGMVPLGTAQLVGGVVQATADISTRVISKGRVEFLMRQANRDMFGPRQLRARIASLDAVAQLSGMPILNDKGKVDKRSNLLLPFNDDDERLSLNAQQRRTKALEPWTSPLYVESLPEVQRPTNIFSKIQAGASERQRNKEERSYQKKRHESHKDWEEDVADARKDYEKEMRKLDKEVRKATKKDGTMKDKDARKIEKDRAKAERDYEKDMRSAEKHRKKDKEEKAMRKILFLIVESVQAQDNGGL